MQLGLDLQYSCLGLYEVRPRRVGIHQRPPDLPFLDCETAALLRHVAGFPDLGLLRGLRPTSALSANSGLSVAANRWRLGWCRDGSHVHHEPIGRVGAQLCPCSLATGTPQAFSVASWPGVTSRLRSCPHEWARTAVQPISARFGVGVLHLRGFGAGFLRTPFYLACRALAVWQCRPSRRRQGCSHPSSRFRGQAALSFARLLRQTGGGALSSPLGFNGASWRRCPLSHTFSGYGK